jgi:hypothetical protein
MNVFAIIRDIFFNLNGCDELSVGTPGDECADNCAPTAPRNLECRMVGVNFIQLTWYNSHYDVPIGGSNVTGFDLEYKTNCNTSFEGWTVSKRCSSAHGGDYEQCENPNESWEGGGDAGNALEGEQYMFKAEDRLIKCSGQTKVSFRLRFINDDGFGPWSDLVELIY